MHASKFLPSTSVRLSHNVCKSHHNKENIHPSHNVIRAETTRRLKKKASGRCAPDSQKQVSGSSRFFRKTDEARKEKLKVHLIHRVSQLCKKTERDESKKIFSTKIQTF